MGDSCFPKEQDSSGSNSIVRFPTVMIYSISILEEADFESIGREMPKGTGIDNCVNDGTMAMGTKRKIKGKHHKRKKGNLAEESNMTLLQASGGGTKSETKLSALHFMLEFGSSKEKNQARREAKGVAFEGGNKTSDKPVDDSSQDEEIQLQDDSTNDSDLL
jgi:hypothetical protein